jgi:hypothetical protein
MTSPRAELSEILPHLELERSMLPGWFGRVRAFCEKHGGRRRYDGVLALLERCEAALGRQA